MNRSSVSAVGICVLNRGRYIPRDHFCIHMQAAAARTQPAPASGILDMNVHIAALIRQSMMARRQTRIFAIELSRQNPHECRVVVGRNASTAVAARRRIPDRKAAREEGSSLVGL